MVGHKRLIVGRISFRRVQRDQLVHQRGPASPVPDDENWWVFDFRFGDFFVPEQSLEQSKARVEYAAAANEEKHRVFDDVNPKPILNQ